MNLHITPGRTPRLAAAGLLVTAAAATMIGMGAATAYASAPKPAAPAGIKVADTSRSSFTVKLKPSANATSYRVYASTVKDDLYQSSIGKHSNRRTYAAATGPRITVTGLKYTTSPYYYRVVAMNAGKMAWSDVSTSGALLEPATPNSLTAATGTQGAPVLSWHAGSATGWTIQESSDSSFDSVHSYTTEGPSLNYTPIDLAQGSTYYFRVCAMNGSSSSNFSDPVSVQSNTASQSLRVLTYNVRSANLAHDEAPWFKRLPGILSLVKQANPDVLGVQEAGSYVKGKERQVDTIAKGLSGYKVANTDTADNGSIVRYSGTYIVYRTAALAPIHKGGHWDIGDGRSAAYEGLKSTTTNAKMLFVSTHLKEGDGTKYENMRQDETTKMVRDANAYAKANHLTSIIYVGDFNSFYGRWHTDDTPGNVMRADDMIDSRQVAQRLYNANYNSINNYKRVAPTGGGASDHVFVSPGIGVHSWGELLHLNGHDFAGIIPSDHNPVWTSLSLPLAG